MVPFATPVIRDVARTEQPSTSAEITATFLDVDRRFMMDPSYYTALAYQAESQAHQTNLGGGVLLLFRPPGLRGLFGDLTPATVGQGFQSPFPADSAALAAHLGHDLQDDRAGSLWRLGAPVKSSYDLPHHPPPVLSPLPP